MLYPDLTALFQMGLFLFVFVVLGKVFFKPYVDLFNARDEAQGITRGDHGHEDHGEHHGAEHASAVAQDAAQLEQIAQLKAKVDALTAELFKETSAMREATLNQARTQGKQVMGDAATKAAKDIDDAKQKVGQVANEVWSGLMTQKDDMIGKIQQKILA